MSRLLAAVGLAGALALSSATVAQAMTPPRTAEPPATVQAHDEGKVPIISGRIIYDDRNVFDYRQLIKGRNVIEYERLFERTTIEKITIFVISKARDRAWKCGVVVREESRAYLADHKRLSIRAEKQLRRFVQHEFLAGRKDISKRLVIEISHQMRYHLDQLRTEHRRC
ncbi:hypothetical protein [Allokutzneria oryzae]|uniref:Uncharacterized protein n=1 Tax=Allokutzneria oryzae TaxID=1378989 RepID=A0ABV6A2X7_9PSEU